MIFSIFNIQYKARWTKAQSIGLLSILIVCYWLTSCANTMAPAPTEEQDLIDSSSLVFHHSYDSTWRGYPLKVSTSQYKKNQFPSYSDSLFLALDHYHHFNYVFGVHESEVPLVLYKAKQEKIARIRFLGGLGIPVYSSKSKEIKYLNLADRGIAAVPPEIGIMSNLEDLLLQNNLIRNIGIQLSFCKKLKRIDLSSNILDRLPSFLGSLSELEELILRDNRLTDLPDAMVQLKKLRILDLSNNHQKLSKSYNDFRYLPPVVCHIHSLEKLLLEKLPITRLPNHFFYLENMKVISISGCYKIDLVHTLDVLGKMPQLQVLDISFLGRTRLPSNIEKLKHLKVLIWQEESGINRDEIEELQALLPNTKIYTGARGEQRPFLRHNSVNTIINAH